MDRGVSRRRARGQEAMPPKAEADGGSVAAASAAELKRKLVADYKERGWTLDGKGRLVKVRGHTLQGVPQLGWNASCLSAGCGG